MAQNRGADEIVDRPGNGSSMRKRSQTREWKQQEETQSGPGMGTAGGNAVRTGNGNCRRKRSQDCDRVRNRSGGE
ncbi:MAG: hypothetical protein IJ794_18325 [Lachnospiraceae bacterium]|nr:hypothetical protein [Lachnospiraceae bacterium]